MWTRSVGLGVRKGTQWSVDVCVHESEGCAPMCLAHPCVGTGAPVHVFCIYVYLVCVCVAHTLFVNVYRLYHHANICVNCVYKCTQYGYLVCVCVVCICVHTNALRVPVLM